MSVSDQVYEAAVQGRREFRAALRSERQKTKRLLAVIANFANEKNWSDEPANLRWDGKRHAIEYAQSVLDESGADALRWPIQAEGIGLIIAEDAVPKPENIPYLAVKIAEACETGNYPYERETVPSNSIQTS